ncbi:hypothetical protein GCM10011506_08020 [Marivirga lumbricoides]|uniref:DUF4249 domain-containing protein n=1 Tax=Marivirga lumbricoides TaxID=1046115 RepID=A0ABQ1LKR5_9BACT|nr:hypothetical protein GCM10011506_08020 [Marivirga lumbricoides]
MKYQSIYYLIFIIVLCSSCIDPFDPKLTNNDSRSQLVVEGLISNNNSVNIITLSRTSSVKGNSGYERESGALVYIIDNDSNCYQLEEISSGRYATSPSDFLTKLGNFYQLKVELNNGQKYESDFQELIVPDELDSLWFKSEEETFLSGNSIVASEVINFYTKNDIRRDPLYYRYDYSGTFAFESVFQGSSACFKGGDRSAIKTQDLICYRNETVNLPLNIVSTEDLPINSESVIKVLTVVPSRQYSIGYSMLITRYSLTSSFFHFLEQLKAQRDVGGSMFDPPPTEIVGNITNVNNPEDRAVGFFSTSSSTSKRLFIDSKFLKKEVRDPLNNENCGHNLDEPGIAQLPEEYLRRPRDYCCDCRLYPGATVQKPSFWPY